MKYWQALLIKQRERGKKGFTIPFIIGSQNYLTIYSSPQDIGELVLDMVENDLFETCIRFCLDTNELICEVRNPENNAVYPKIEEKEQNNLSLASLNSDLGDSIDEVIDNLKEKYQDTIDAGKYSVKRDFSTRETIWTPFSSSDEAFIQSCFEKLTTL